MDNPSVIELHVFGDASELAFCSVANSRFSYAGEAVRCAFVTAKTRVAPKKPLSIPKLELQAVVLSARLSAVVIKEHDYNIDSKYLWTDSSTVFQWIRCCQLKSWSKLGNSGSARLKQSPFPKKLPLLRKFYPFQARANWFPFHPSWTKKEWFVLVVGLREPIYHILAATLWCCHLSMSRAVLSS